MKVYDYNPVLSLGLVTDDDGENTRYEAIPNAELPELEKDAPKFLLRQKHYVANAIASGLVITGRRINIVPTEWFNRAGR